MNIILQGEVIIQGLDAKGKDIKFSNLLKGDFFGEIALISEESRSVNAVVKLPSKMVALFRSDLLNIIQRFPKLGNKILLNLATVLGTRLIRAHEIIINNEVK